MESNVVFVRAMDTYRKAVHTPLKKLFQCVRASLTNRKVFRKRLANATIDEANGEYTAS